MRTGLRIKENRARPIDVLSKNLLLDANFDMEMTEPYRIFRGLPKVSLFSILACHSTVLIGRNRGP